MLHGIYHEDGPDERLRFKGALLRNDPDNELNFLVQFDPLWLPEAHGWHPFPKKYFVNLTPIGAVNEP